MLRTILACLIYPTAQQPKVCTGTETAFMVSASRRRSADPIALLNPTPKASPDMETPGDSPISSFPSFLLYASSAMSAAAERLLSWNPPSPAMQMKAQTESTKIEMHSPLFYVACTFGGIASCGLTHLAVTPLDLVKCNMQVTLLNL